MLSRRFLKLLLFLLLSDVSSCIESEEEKPSELIQDFSWALDDMPYFYAKINHERRKFGKNNGVHMNELGMDESLQNLASRTMMSCDSQPYNTFSFRKLRLVVSLKGITRTGVTDYSVNILEYLPEFTQFLNTNAFSLSNIPETSRPLLDLFHPEQGRIGCSVKVCTTDAPDYTIFNYLCFLGPEKTINDSLFVDAKSHGACVNFCEEPSPITNLESLKKHVLKVLNAERAQFAKTALAANMYTMIWNDKLAEEAANSSKKCRRERGPEYIYLSVYEPLILGSTGEMKAGEYLVSVNDDISMENRNYARFQWNHTTVGCALRDKECKLKDVVCVMGVLSYNVKVEPNSLFRKGEPCSLCEEGCRNNLCLGEPPEEFWDIAGGSHRVFAVISIVIVAVLVMVRS